MSQGNQSPGASIYRVAIGSNQYSDEFHQSKAREDNVAEIIQQEIRMRSQEYLNLLKSQDSDCNLDFLLLPANEDVQVCNVDFNNFDSLSVCLYSHESKEKKKKERKEIHKDKNIKADNDKFNVFKQQSQMSLTLMTEGLKKKHQQTISRINAGKEKFEKLGKINPYQQVKTPKNSGSNPRTPKSQLSKNSEMLFRYIDQLAAREIGKDIERRKNHLKKSFPSYSNESEDFGEALQRHNQRSQHSQQSQNYSQEMQLADIGWYNHSFNSNGSNQMLFDNSPQALINQNWSDKKQSIPEQKASLNYSSQNSSNNSHLELCRHNQQSSFAWSDESFKKSDNDQNNQQNINIDMQSDNSYNLSGLKKSL